MTPLWLALLASADAAPRERPVRLGEGVALELLVNVGPLHERRRFGVAASAYAERTWLDRPYWSPGGVQAAPAYRGTVEIGWTPVSAFSGVALQVGGVLSDPSDWGYLPLGGLYGGMGLGMATDGFAGPLLMGTAVGPLVQARAVGRLVEKRPTAARLHLGPMLPVTCCGTYL